MDVADYYERNTSIFLKLGKTGGIGAIHREVWADGVTSVLEAVDHVHHLLKGRFPDGARVLDLGCGVGGSLCRLAQLDPSLQGHGVTISPKQAALATERAAGLGLSDRCSFQPADFHALPETLTGFDGAYAIEAWAHANDPAALLAGAARAIRPGGQLIIIDDFVGDGTDAKAEATRDEVREGWQFDCLVTPEEATRHAEAAGFRLVEDIDLTAYLNLWRPRDYGIAALVTAFGFLPIRHPYWGSLKGGYALQRCLTKRWLTYRVLRFERV